MFIPAIETSLHRSRISVESFAANKAI